MLRSHFAKWYKSTPSVSTLGALLLGIGILMIVAGGGSAALFYSGGSDIETPGAKPPLSLMIRHVGCLAPGQSLLGCLVGLAAWRFMKRRRWTRTPFIAFVGLINAWIVAFSGIWLWHLHSMFIGDDAFPIAVRWTFGIGMALMGLGVSATFLFFFSVLLTLLSSPHVRVQVREPGF